MAMSDVIAHLPLTLPTMTDSQNVHCAKYLFFSILLKTNRRMSIPYRNLTTYYHPVLILPTLNVTLCRSSSLLVTGFSS